MTLRLSQPGIVVAVLLPVAVTLRRPGWTPDGSQRQRTTFVRCQYPDRRYGSALVVGFPLRRFAPGRLLDGRLESTLRALVIVSDAGLVARVGLENTSPRRSRTESVRLFAASSSR